MTVFLVPDTLIGLQKLGNYIRKQTDVKVLGITGSNGKTTTKEFTATILGSCRKTHFNVGSFNNHWGVPLTLLQIPRDAEFAIVEMGMNHYGEITELVKIAEPNVVTCTMVGRAHIEFFGTRDNIAKAKAEIYEHADPQGAAVFNMDDDMVAKMFATWGSKFKTVRRFGSEGSAPVLDVCLKIDSMNLHEMNVSGSIAGVSGKVSVGVFGEQNITNLMAAATLAVAAGLTPQEIWSGLKLCKTAWGRNQLVKLNSGSELIFDAYNANPDSMKALLSNVAKLSVNGKKIAVLGQMKEMGSHSAVLHEELGALVAQSKVDEVFFIGDDYKNFAEGLERIGFAGRRHIQADFSEDLGLKLKNAIGSADLVFLKASRGTALERFMPYCDPLDFKLPK